MQYAAITGRRHEPAFDVPPFFAGGSDRRLAGRAAAIWAAHRYGDALPDLATFTAALADDPDFTRHGVVFEVGERVALREVGAAVAATFGLDRDGRSTPLGGLLGAMCTGFVDRPVPTRFERGFAGTGGITILLTRGVVLPLSESGRLAAAFAVLTWTEILSPAANDRLYREFEQAIVPRPRYPGTVSPFPPARR